MEFWPGNLNEWAGLFLQTLTIASIVLGAIWKLFTTAIGKVQRHFDDRLKDLERSLDEKFKSQGERIGHVETRVAHGEGKIQDLNSKAQATEFRLMEVNKDYGRIEGMLERLDDNLSSHGRRDSELDSQLRERLAGIEGKMEAFTELVALAREYMQRRS